MVILILIVIVIKIIVNIIITTSITPPLVHHFFNPPKFDNTHALESSGESFFSPWWKESLMANFWKPTNFRALLLPGLPRMPTAWKTSFPASCGSKNTTSLCQPIPCWERENISHPAPKPPFWVVESMIWPFPNFPFETGPKRYIVGTRLRGNCWSIWLSNVGITNPSL